MRKRLIVVAGSLAALAAGGVPGADAGGRPLSTVLTGSAQEGSGDTDAVGLAKLRLNQGQNRVCFDVSWEDVDGEVFASHIHKAPPGTAGPIAVPLFSGSFAGTGAMSGCVEDVSRALIKEIRQNPERFYVNVHSRPDFPGGAIRGQLG